MDMLSTVFESYLCFGDDPWIEGVEFLAFEYAEMKIKEVLKGQNKYPTDRSTRTEGFGLSSYSFKGQK